MELETKQQRRDWLHSELKKAYLQARLNKTKKPQVAAFDKIAKKELWVLTQEIYQKTYIPRPSTAFIVNKPVKREIFAADFRDRIVHHFIFNQVSQWWNARFIEDSYSCRKNKGTLYGVIRLAHHIQSESCNYSCPAYVLKLDILGYFMSLNRKKLYERAMWGLRRQFPQQGYAYQVGKFLWKTIIFNDPLQNVTYGCPHSAWKGLPASKSLFHQPKGQGIAIGNLTSQLLSNIYLDQLDRFVTLELGFKHYGRYVDDFFIISADKERLKMVVKTIEMYLHDRLLLQLHPKKRYLQECHKGVSFIGATVYPFRILPGQRLKRHLVAALSDSHHTKATDVSYRGLVKYYRHTKLLQPFAPMI